MLPKLLLEFLHKVNSNKKYNEFIVHIIIFLLVILAIKGLFVIGQFIGFVINQHAGSAGNIYTLVIQHRRPTFSWAGIYGVAVRVPGYTNQQEQIFKEGDNMKDVNLLFDCMQKDIQKEVYASTAGPDEIDFSMLYPASPAEVDAWMNKDPNDFDSATNTYTDQITFNLGTSSITIPGTYTYSGDGNKDVFATGIAKDPNGNFVFVAILGNFTEGFNTKVYNYQMLLPLVNPNGTKYYFYTDPNDQCPEGEEGDVWFGTVIGNVTNELGTRLQNVIVDVAGHTALSDINGHYNLSAPAGNFFIYAIKEGYQTYKNNITVIGNNITVHNIVMVAEETPNPYTGIGTGVDNPGSSSNIGPDFNPDVGPGEYDQPPSPYVEQPKKVEGTDFLITLNDLKRKLRLDTFVQESIYIFNFKDKAITATFKINGSAKDIIQLEKEQLIVDPDSNAELYITIFGKGKPGDNYNGTLIVDGDINATIPIDIEILTKDKLPVEALDFKLETARKEYLPKEKLKFKADLRNLLTDQQYPVSLLFTIQPLNKKEIIWSDSINAQLRTAFSIIREVKLPNDLEAGDYVLRGTASYLGLTSSASTIFRVNVPFWQRVFLGLRYWHWLLILIIILLLAGTGYAIYRNIESKKKYHLKVELSELPKPGPRSIFVGKIAETDHKTYFNLEQFKTHTIVAGSTGGGKSVSAQVIIEEALEKNVAVIVFDPTAQWTGMLRPCKDKTMLSLYPLFGMKKSEAKAYNGNIRMITDAREYIDIKKYIKPGEIQVFCFHKLDPKDMDVVVANAIRSIFRSGPQESKLLKVLFVFDEVHRLLPKFGGSGDGFLQIERACREFRKWGMGVVLISQVLSDFVGTIKANINTEIQMRTRDEGDLERIRQKYGEGVLRSLVKATVGTGMVENPSYNRGRPYFVAFRPLKHSVERLSDEEIEKYNNYNDKIDNLFYSLKQLEDEGIDVFDLKLELKLALDKVKSGNFNMVDVYLEGLIPRINKHWEKLGKKPKVLEKKLVNMDELKEELEKAKQERDKYVAEHQTKKESDEKKEFGWKDDVSPEKILNLVNGMLVINLASLYDEIAAMKDDDLKKEFNPEPEEGEKPINKFAEWVLNAIGDTKLAYALANAKTKEELLSILEKKKNGEDLGDVKPPKWFLESINNNSNNNSNENNTKDNKTPDNSDISNDSSSNNINDKKNNNINNINNKNDNSEEIVNNNDSNNTNGINKNINNSQNNNSKSNVERTNLENKVKNNIEENNISDIDNKTINDKNIALKDDNSNSLKNNELNKSFDNKGGDIDINSDNINNLQSIINKTVPEDKAFKLENGKEIYSIKELRDYLKEMPEELFYKHVGNDYNHFAQWIKDVFENQELASKLSQAKTKNDFERVLNNV